MKELLEGKKILYVEDETELAKMVSDELTDYGAVVTCVEEVSLATEHLAGTKFDLIIADYLLKDGTGDTFVNDVKTEGGKLYQEAPIIFTSAFVGKELMDELEGKVAGMLVKPHTMGRLLDKIREVLS
ncbi:MAG: hypothetical protein BM556_11710 [Bacteriovorax sp. MedPE-SWde]|nr:MAG: hypothetical protein BM556_11710 [Bacteriovorax sp. MedPE-SWde]